MCIRGDIGFVTEIRKSTQATPTRQSAEAARLPLRGRRLVITSILVSDVQMRKYRFTSKVPDPRVLCVSYRDIAPVPSRCIRYEFEDLISAMDAVDVIAPADPIADVRTPARAVRALQRLEMKLEGRFPGAGVRRLPPDLLHTYDLLLVSIESVADLYNLGPVAMWRSTARLSVCYIQELYAGDIPALGDVLKILEQFDHIVVGYRGTVGPLAEATGRQCHYLAPSIDALKFCPYPRGPRRVIDFYAMGRRPPETHKALLRMADAGDWYYMYDTATNAPIASPTEHRHRLVEMIKRSRFFLVNAARFNDPERTGDQQELGYRYFEGAAAGAVLVGGTPDDPSFAEYFGWPDSVISLPFDSGDIADVIAGLEADPRRLERISKTNVVNSLRRNDHVYRWSQILALAGLKETESMACRRRELAMLATSVEGSMSQGE